MFGSRRVIVIDDRACMVQLGAPRRAVLHARVVRQVHAVPRGDALDGAAARRSSRTAAPSRRSSTCSLRSCDRDHRQVPLRARRLAAAMPGRELRATSSATSSSATSTRAAARSAATRRSRASSRRSTSTPTPPSQRCRREPARARHGHDRRARDPGPAGHGLVEAALHAGIEIPVFCYEPRLGPADRRLPHVPRARSRACRSCRPPAR